MRLKTLPAAIAVLSALPLVAVAQTNVIIYGRADVSSDSTTGASKAQKITNNGSRLGFKGKEDLGSGLAVVFGYEFGVEFDVSVATTNRHSYVGLAGSLGAFALGRLDSGTVTGSPIYSLIVNNASFVIHDAGVPAIGTKVLNARNRTSNSIGYKSPEMGGLTFMARYAFNGEEETEKAAGPVKVESDVKQLYLGLNYRTGKFGGGLGYGQNRMVDGLRNNEFDKKWIAVASYDFGFIKPHAIYGRDMFNNTATTRGEVDFWVVGAKVPVGNNGHVSFNVMEREVQADKHGSLKKFQIGYGHNLSKRTMLFALFDREDPNSHASKDVVRNISIGMQHNF